MSQLGAYITDRIVVPRPDCLIWTGGLVAAGGYGGITVDGKAYRVHRLVWEMEHGPIPEGLTIDHLCYVRACCNTSHMELVTLAENSRRGNERRRSLGLQLRSLRPHRALEMCRNGHPYTEDNTRYRSNGYRSCRICQTARERRRNPRKRAPKTPALAPIVQGLEARDAGSGRPPGPDPAPKPGERRRPSPAGEAGDGPPLASTTR